RTGGPYPNSWPTTYYNSDPAGPPFLARSDYACNSGYAVDPKTAAILDPPDGDNENGPGPTTLAQGDAAAFWAGYTGAYARKWVGVIYQRSEIRITDISNGTSNTYLLGEKYLQPEHYKDGQDGSDNEHMYIGADNDIEKITLRPPLQDKKLLNDTKRFGSVHVGGCNMLYADGRVEVVSYSVDQAVHQRAGDRR